MTKSKIKGFDKKLILVIFITVEILLYVSTYYRIISFNLEVIGSLAVIILILGLYFPFRKKSKSQEAVKPSRKANATVKKGQNKKR
jgi:hypothetical protein